MNYTIQQNKEFAIKLMLMELDKIIDKIQAINRGDLVNLEYKKIIKEYED